MYLLYVINYIKRLIYSFISLEMSVQLTTRVREKERERASDRGDGRRRTRDRSTRGALSISPAGPSDPDQLRTHCRLIIPLFPAVIHFPFFPILVCPLPVSCFLSNERRHLLVLCNLWFRRACVHDESFGTECITASMRDRSVASMPWFSSALGFL